jgi:hypothetical protein
MAKNAVSSANVAVVVSGEDGRSEVKRQRRGPRTLLEGLLHGLGGGRSIRSDMSVC